MSQNQGKCIWIINQYAGSVYHGKEYRSPAIARALTKRGYDVTIISSSHSHHFKKAPQVKGLYTQKTIENVRHLWVRTEYSPDSKSYKRLMNMFEFVIKSFFLPHKKLPEPDFIIVSSPSPLPIFNGIYFKRKFRAKLIFEVRDLWPLSVIELGNMSPKHPLVRFLSFVEKTAYSRSDLVISLLKNAGPYMQTQGLDEKKFLYVPNGIDTALLQSKKSAPQTLIEQIDVEKFVVGYAGALGIANNLYALIDAAEILVDYKGLQIVLLGSGSEEKKLKVYAEKKGLKNVIFPGSVTREEVHDVLNCFDVCYLGLQKSPLFHYGVSPTKLYDYMAVSKPILYAIDSGNHPVVDANCGIEVNSGKAEDIAEAIITFYKKMSSNKRKRLGDNGYEVLVGNFTFDKLTDKIIERMESL